MLVLLVYLVYEVMKTSSILIISFVAIIIASIIGFVWLQTSKAELEKEKLQSSKTVNTGAGISGLLKTFMQSGGLNNL